MFFITTQGFSFKEVVKNIKRIPGIGDFEVGINAEKGFAAWSCPGYFAVDETGHGWESGFSASVIAARNNGTGCIFTEWPRSRRDGDIV